MSFFNCSEFRRGAHYAVLSACLALASSVSSFSQAAERDGSVIGDWRLIKVLDSVDVTSLDDEGANKLLGKVMMIRKDGARFENYKCQAPDFEGARVEPNMYLEKEGGIDNSKLKLPTPVIVFDISCAIVFVKNRNHVVVTWGGYFFEAERVKQ